jgi:hypothetical protein
VITSRLTVFALYPFIMTMLTPVAIALQNWIPFRLSVQQDVPYCHWLYTGDKLYNDPFFDDTIARCRSLPQNSRAFRSISTVDILPQWAAEIAAASPAAFIFHVSRCGSTLFAQLLGLPEQHIVMAEVPFIDQLLRLPYQQKDVDTGLLQQALPAAFQLYGHQRKGIETHLFVKTDSWHLCFYRQLRQLYPKVPFILLYRTPDEVIQSHRKQRGMQAVQGVVEPAIFGFNAESIQQYTLDEYMAKVLEHYFILMREIATTDVNTMLVNYQEPVMEVMQRIAALTGITITEAEALLMEERSRFHAKYPGQVFEEPKIIEDLPGYLLRAMELYQQLEGMRMSS